MELFMFGRNDGLGVSALKLAAEVLRDAWVARVQASAVSLCMSARRRKSTCLAKNARGTRAFAATRPLPHRFRLTQSSGKPHESIHLCRVLLRVGHAVDLVAVVV